MFLLGQGFQMTSSDEKWLIAAFEKKSRWLKLKQIGLEICSRLAKNQIFRGFIQDWFIAFPKLHLEMK